MTGTTIRLIDREDGPGRTTATLLASLAARLAVLHVITGAGAVGSLVAGFAALGRRVSLTADGQLLRRRLEATRAAKNGEMIWQSLAIGRWATASPASPVLDQLRNDLALLLAEDLEETFALQPLPGSPARRPPEDDDADVTFLDCMLGLREFARQLVAGVDKLAAMGREPDAIVPESVAPVPAGELLR